MSDQADRNINVGESVQFFSYYSAAPEAALVVKGGWDKICLVVFNDQGHSRSESFIPRRDLGIGSGCGSWDHVPS